MTLRYPWILLLLLLIPLLFLRKRQGVDYSATGLLGQLPGSWALQLRWLPKLLMSMGFAALVVALSRPQTGLEESRVRTEVVDIVLVLDLSTSMRALDMGTATREQNRLEAAKEVIETFINSRENDRIGLVAYAALPYTAAPLTLEHGWLIQQVNNLEIGMLEDGTAIGDALAAGVNRLRESEAETKLVVLLTDGENNQGDISPDKAAEAAAALGIKVYTVGTGKEGMVKYPVRGPMGTVFHRNVPSQIDETALRSIAEKTGAKFFRAQNRTGLEQVYEEIDELEKTEIEVEQYALYEEEFQFLPWWE